jgi:hypothetical protein
MANEAQIPPDMQPRPVQLPHGVPILENRSHQGPLMKMMGKMMKMRMPKTGIKTHSTVHISHGKRGKGKKDGPTFY